MNERTLKSALYEQVARMGKALASPKRLELLEVLAQGEQSVDALAQQLGIDMKLTSAHLKALREARLVEGRREGKFMVYRLTGADVAVLGVQLRAVAEAHLLEFQRAFAQLVNTPERLTPLDRKTLMAQARRGEVVVIDVRPAHEYDTAHLPHARSVPLDELRQRLAALPKDREIVAYCRGPFCLMSDEAVALLRAEGFQARKISDGVSEWQAAGLALAA
ncbi:MAG: metalloregulator ArsR/SmtB family transcription factor [Hydrogenophaga sp.]|jgi:rhodanese-related sulfurtransferase|uniref:ArsR/SmtB family transcription factor n=1 Tax=Hydrogenophaga sp. TaxID=1904254 RepID=UPI00275C546D|nr:metalloregulator ArsR/SmtB family transcription factor [Hydrogenophaga sp.]MDP2418896.1 metalloregulator ArsR/SmtB family transcription factor [Hydrogenophaga sp.]MDZ4187521.1 metalloregulator ArsR/SmtB family transcription factor [Hydrogenophaga sp.]